MATPEQLAARRARRNYATEYAARKAKAQTAGFPGVAAERRSRAERFVRAIRQQMFPQSGRRQTSVSGSLTDFRSLVRALQGSHFQSYAVRLRLSSGKWIQSQRWDTPRDALDDARAKAKAEYGAFAIREVELVGFNRIADAA